MKISSSICLMRSNHQSENLIATREKLDMWIDAPQSLPKDRLTLSDKARSLSLKEKKSRPIADPKEVVEKDPGLFLIKKIIEALTGKEIKLIDLPEITEASSGAHPEGVETSTESGQSGWGLRYERQESRIEREDTRFRATGVVRTADGAEINFSIDLTMSREFVDNTQLSLRAGDALRLDPLVVNFGGTAAQLTDQRFAFDLNSDGRDEKIPFVAPSSGILVFDRNGDHQVNDGRELFGPGTGNGFSELMQYDDDGNRWIDEGDAIYKSLYVWARDLENDYLLGLRERGIGAISTYAVDTSFALKDPFNVSAGEITRSGVYLDESGQAGTIQQMDLFV